MSKPYHALPSHRLHPQTSCHHYNQGLPEMVGLDNPATDAMTDLKRVKAITVDPATPIDTALQKMIYAEVRLLLVTNDSGGILGLITARDIMGEKPINHAARARIPHEAILVEYIMTPSEQIQVLRMGDVLRASVGDIILTLKEANRQHALVVEPAGEGMTTGSEIVRGIFSTTQIGKQLGVEIQPTGKVQNFAELEALLGKT